jgi:lipoic acid synthetase
MNTGQLPEQRKRLPDWLRRKLPDASAVRTHETLAMNKLNTVCESALCPNRSECYARKTATFMILGDVCTRSCGFCAIKTGRGLTVENDEPRRVAAAARDLGLKYVVVTSVARDDLADEGAEHFAQTIREIRLEIPNAQIEVLTPDFHARRDLIEIVVKARPEVFNHNLETVKRLQKQVRPQASYGRSLEVLRLVKAVDPTVSTKSGIMLGLGEAEDEVLEAARDLRDAGCDILTLGQYLAPSQDHLAMVEYIRPEFFDQLARKTKAMGFREVFAGPYVRSSYHAGEVFSAASSGSRESSHE